MLFKLSNSPWEKFILRTCLGVTALVCSQCADLYYGQAPRGQTRYLNSADAGRSGYVAEAPQAPVRDTESYWKGNGVSGAPGIVISLSKQKAWFYKGDNLVGMSIISSGDANHPTPTGQFAILQKDARHRSSQYGDYVNNDGEIVKAEVDRNVDRMPPGSHYVGTMMPYFMRFTAGKGMHAGFLPGYPASHGCVRMPEEMARVFFENATEGTPLDVRR